MTKEKARELSNILKAYSEDKTIQINTLKGWKDLEKLNLGLIQNLLYFPDTKCLRVKPELKLVPFTFEDKKLFLGKIIKNRRSNLYNIIVGASPQTIWIGSVVNGLTYFELWEQYELEDGSPCGKYVEE